ncbi:hypothetical protein [Mucilaginibacter antarcticus]|uniref:hypothetical protein n=1 Tax=Mucilaginibacter antarcticus TaxID=1855725 RepID=UPI0036414377
MFKKAGAYLACGSQGRSLATAGAAVIEQKIDYTHNNPVVAGFVENDYEYLHSSARDYAGIKGLVKVIIT